MKCRICNKDTIGYLNLGNHPPSDNFLTKEQLEEAGERVHPLALVYCPSCSLSQLSHVVPAHELYNSEYPYETGLNSGGVKHFEEMAQSIQREFTPNYVVDIGSNDGTLLSGFDCKVCGIDPVPLKAKVHTINRFFTLGAVNDALEYGGEADVVTATNVFAHIDDLHGFMECLKYLLAYDGVFIIEAPYFMDLVDNLAFDTVYHEHLSYLSIKPLAHLFRKYDMEIFNVRHFPIHCGTMRYYVARKGLYKIRKAVDKYFDYELEYNINRLNEFAFDVDMFKFMFRNSLRNYKWNGKSIVGVSAPAKGNTLLNYCEIDTTILDYITEKSDKKIGRFTPGTHIPVVPDSRLIEDQPDYAVILAHNWAEQIKESLKDYKGEWVIPNGQGLKDLYRRSLRVGRLCNRKRVAA